MGPENRNSTQTTKIGEESARNKREEKRIEGNSSQIHLQTENCNELVTTDYECQQHILSPSQKVNYMANRPQKTLHENEMETSELHRSVWTTP